MCLQLSLPFGPVKFLAVGSHQQPLVLAQKRRRTGRAALRERNPLQHLGTASY